MERKLKQLNASSATLPFCSECYGNYLYHHVLLICPKIMSLCKINCYFFFFREIPVNISLNHPHLLLRQEYVTLNVTSMFLFTVHFQEISVNISLNPPHLLLRQEYITLNVTSTFLFTVHCQYTYIVFLYITFFHFCVRERVMSCFALLYFYFQSALLNMCNVLGKLHSFFIECLTVGPT